MLNIAFAHNTSAIGFAVFSCCFCMVLVLGEQNCKSHGAFKANVNIEVATWRRTLSGGFQGAHKRFKNQ